MSLSNTNANEFNAMLVMLEGHIRGHMPSESKMLVPAMAVFISNR